MFYLRSFNRLILIGLALLGLSVSSANAMLIGDTVDCATTGPSWGCAPLSAVVTDPGSEFDIQLRGFSSMDVDITDNSLNFDILLGVGNIFGLGPLSILNIDSEIIGFQFNTDIAGMNASRLSFTTSAFLIDFDGLSTQAGEFLDIELAFVSAVPVPAAIWLFGTALIGFVGLSRRRQIA